MVPLKNLRLAAPASLAAVLLLAACSEPAAPVAEVRPVRAIVVHASNVDVNAQFSGEVRARVESRLGFRVGGKITSRKVDPGTMVKRGQVLMQLDPQDLRLSQEQSRASLRAAETARDLAKAELKRYQELRVKNFVSQAVLDGKMSAWRAAQANVDSAQAAFFGQSNQASYSTLVADVDGVVTAVEADVGQVVSPGMPVVRVAKAGDKEIVIGLPEDQVEKLRQVQDVTVRLWARPDVAIPGKVREVSPVADPATRTYAVKVSIPDAAGDVKLGMTALVQFSSTTPTAQIRVPLTALHHDNGRTSVWVVEKGAVRKVPVTLKDAAGNDVLVDGVTSGQTVVTAGVNLLTTGQKVKILAPDPVVPATRPAPAAGAAQ